MKILGAAGGGAPDTDTFQEYGRLLARSAGNVVQVETRRSPSTRGNTNCRGLAGPELQRAINQFLHPDLAVADRLTDADSGKDTTEQAHAAGSSARARRASRSATAGTEGRARRRRVPAGRRGWKRVFADGNADNFAYLHTTIFHDGTTGGQAIAAALDKDFKPARQVKR